MSFGEFWSRVQKKKRRRKMSKKKKKVLKRNKEKLKRRAQNNSIQEEDNVIWARDFIDSATKEKLIKVKNFSKDEIPPEIEET